MTYKIFLPYEPVDSPRLSNPKMSHISLFWIIQVFTYMTVCVCVCFDVLAGNQTPNVIS